MTSSRQSILGLLLAAATSFGVGCHGGQDQLKPPQGVRVEAVSSGVSQGTMLYSGSALAQTQVDLSFKVGGYVHSIATVKDTHGRTRQVQAGDRVTKGMVLASLREADYKAKLAEMGGMSHEASSGFTRSRSDLARAKTLLASGAISQAEFDATKARYDSATGSTAAASARVGEASIALSDARPKAPFDGIVVNRGIDVGALVAPGTVACTIADTSAMRVTFAVPDTVQRALAIDQPAMITTDAYPARVFTGALSKIAMQADAKTRSFEVEATVDNADGALKIGMVMLIQLSQGSGGTTQASALIPLSAVVRPPNGQTGFAVFAVTSDHDGETAHARMLQLGDLVANRVSVTAGLKVGDRVVVQGATLLTEGQRVVLVP